MANKAWIGVDLDGTLAEYNGWEGPEHIGPPVPKMLQHIKNLISLGWCVKIFTARVCSQLSEEEINTAKKAIEEWCTEYIGQKLEITSEKDFYMVEYYDDRAIKVNYNEGTF